MSRGIRYSSRDGGSGGRGAGQPPKGSPAGQEVKMPARLEMLLDMPNVSRSVQLLAFTILNSTFNLSRDTQVKHAWNSEDRSLNIFVKVKAITLTPVKRSPGGRQADVPPPPRGPEH